MVSQVGRRLVSAGLQTSFISDIVNFVYLGYQAAAGLQSRQVSANVLSGRSLLLYDYAPAMSKLKRPLLKQRT